MSELKSCPFCGGSPFLGSYSVTGCTFAIIECYRCELRMEGAKSLSKGNKVFLERAEQSLIEKWNTRYEN